MPMHKCLLDDLEEVLTEVEKTEEVIGVFPVGNAAVIITKPKADRAQGIEKR